MPRPMVTLEQPSFDATPEQLAFPYVRSPARYGISPYGLRTALKDPALFYFNYCGPRHLRIGGFQQTGPMAVGSGVDGKLKQWMFKNMDITQYRAEPQKFGLWCGVDKDQQTPEVRKKIMDTFRAIMKSPLPKELIDFRLIDMETTRDKPVVVHGVPTNGRLDFLLEMPGDVSRFVVDLKCNGSFSKTGTSPIPGYKWKFEWDPFLKKGKLSGPHVQAGLPLEELHPDYALQLATYALQEEVMQQGTSTPYIFQPTPTMLWQATYKPPSKEPKVRKDGTKRDWFGREGRIVITNVDSYISGAFKNKVLENYRAVYNGFQSRTLIPQDRAIMGLPIVYTQALRNA